MPRWRWRARGLRAAGRRCAAAPRRCRSPTDRIVDALGAASVDVVPIPRDCIDGFYGAFWARPARYLDPAARAAMSRFARVGADAIAEGCARLRADLDSGAWQRVHGAALAGDTADMGYRLVVQGKRS